jgi:hypothetical protein
MGLGTSLVQRMRDAPERASSFDDHAGCRSTTSVWCAVDRH